MIYYKQIWEKSETKKEYENMRNMKSPKCKKYTSRSSEMVVVWENIKLSDWDKTFFQLK